MTTDEIKEMFAEGTAHEVSMTNVAKMVKIISQLLEENETMREALGKLVLQLEQILDMNLAADKQTFCHLLKHLPVCKFNGPLDISFKRAREALDKYKG